jgi:GntR family transcriptional regulator / MocR family aminotransferase
MTRPRAGLLPPIHLQLQGAPAHRQICDWLRGAITDGRLRPGQGVPSSRALAVELGISRTTVMTAFEQLQAEGYLESVVGAGTRIAAVIPDDVLDAIDTTGRRYGGQRAPRAISTRGRTLLALPQDSQPQIVGAFRACIPALDRFPHATWSALLRRHARHASPTLMAYGDPMGHGPLRDALAGYLGAARAARCDASQIMITAGAQQALQLCARVLLDPGEAIWMEEPGYPGAQRAFTEAGARLVPVPVDQHGLDVEEGIRREPHPRAVYITPSHQYPMGAIMNAARRTQLLAAAARTGSWIIEDDYDSEYRFAGRPIASLQGLDTDERVIYVGTFSKVLFPALRVGYLVLPKDLVVPFRAARDAADLFPPTLLQAALADFLREGHFARHIGRMRMLYKQRCAALVRSLRTQLGERFEIVNAEAGLHLVALLPPAIDDRAVGRRLVGFDIAVGPLSDCCLQNPARGGLILGYGSSSEAQLENAVAKLAAVLAAMT